MSGYECFTLTEFGMLLAENGQKAKDFEPIYLGNYRY